MNVMIYVMPCISTPVGTTKFNNARRQHIKLTLTQHIDTGYVDCNHRDHAVNLGNAPSTSTKQDIATLGFVTLTV